MLAQSMIEVCDLTEKNVEDIATFCGRYKSNGSPSEAKNMFFVQGEERKKKVLLEKLKRGGRGKIAYKENKPVGFIEYYPIEDAPLNIVGKDIAIIPCMNVEFDERKKGIGGKLIRACIEDARNMRRKGVAVRATEWQDFMPRTFFEKYGFTSVTKSGPISILMLKYEEVENPRWLTLSYKQKPSDVKLIIDIFHNDQCPFNWQNSERVKKIAREFADRAEVNDFDTNKRESILKYGTSRAIIVNGEYLGGGPPLSEEEIRKTFQERLKTTP